MKSWEFLDFAPILSLCLMLHDSARTGSENADVMLTWELLLQAQANMGAVPIFPFGDCDPLNGP